MIDPAPAMLIVLGAAVLFAAAARHKLTNLPLFADAFAAYRLLPEAAARRWSWTIPCVEIGIAAALVWPPSRAGAVMAAIALFAAYASALALNLARNRRDLDCGCAGTGERRPIAAWMVWRNLLLAAAMGTAALPWSVRALTGTDFFTVVGGLAAALVLYEAVDRLLGDVGPRAAALRAAR
jgi:Methylamine utilisation protein MauE